MTAQTKIFTTVCLLLFTAVFTACSSESMGGAYYATPMPGTGGAAVAQDQPTDGGQARLDAQATLQAIAYVEQQQTAVAQAATAQAVATVQAQQTAVAYATQAAQATTEAIATGTAVAVVATEEARAADMHALEMEATRVAITQQQIAVAQQATLDASLIADQQERMLMQRESEAARLEYERVWNYWLKPILIVLLVMVLFGAAMFALHSAWLYVNYRLNPVHVVTEQPGTQLFVNPNYAPFRQISGGQPLALPAPAEPIPPQVEEDAEHGRAQLPAPKWEAMILFMQRGDGSRIPLGVDESGAPFMLDRNRRPHVAIAGTTGAGKTASMVVPYVAGLLAAGVHVIVVNGKGADYKLLEGHNNLTIVPALRDRTAAPRVVSRIVNGIMAERNIRDRILYETGVGRWQDVPDNQRHSGEIALVIDEFLTVINNAKSAAADPRIKADDPEEARELQGAVLDMWDGLGELVNEGRKYGLFMVVTMTDPASRNLDDAGMAVLSQMTRLCARMESGALSRSFLNIGKGSDYPQGSAGLPVGEFLALSGGRLRRVRGFYPKPTDIKRLYDGVPVPTVVLPETVRTAVSGNAYSNGAIPADTWPTTPRTAVVTAAERDSNLLDILAKEGDVVSLNQVALFLTNSDSGRASGEDYERAAEALMWRVANRQCPWATAVVLRSGSKYLDEAKAMVGG